MGREIREAVTEGVGDFLLQTLHGVNQIADNGIPGAEDHGEAGNFIVEKWHQFLLLLQNAAAFMAGKLEHILPAGARSEALHHWLVVAFLVLFVAAILLIALPLLLCSLKCLLLCFVNLVRGVVAAVVSLLALIWVCLVGVATELIALISSLGRGFVVCFRTCFPRSFAPAGKMMRAPGRPGQWIFRPVFESNPAGYFRTLRAEA